MSRTIKEIYAAIITEKDSLESLEDLGYTADDTELLLQDLNSSSKVAIWRLWAYITAVTIFFHEKLWDVFKADVETRLKTISGTNEWLANECRKFQYGDELLFDNTTRSYYYQTEDPAKQIVKRVAITENFGFSTVKVATEINGNTTALTPAQESSLAGYVDLIQYAGASLKVVSLPGDEIDLKIEVYHTPLVPTLDVESAVEAKVDEYLANMEFNGTFRVLSLIDAIQTVDDVIDLRIDHVKAGPAGSETEPVTRVYFPVSGYFSTVDKSAITYTPES